MKTLLKILGELLGEFAENPFGFVVGIVIIAALAPVALTQLGKLFSLMQPY